MVTTSSCSGRVSVFLEGIKTKTNTKTQIGAKGNEGRWLFVTHDPEELHGWHEKVAFEYESAEDFASSDSTRYILFKFEPLILHVKCRDAASANSLFSTAMACGFRETGIGSNNIVGIRISIKLDVPIGFLQGDRLVTIVSEEYLKVLTKLSLDRFKENFRKMAQLEAAIKLIKQEEHIVSETKEERRLRKLEEGMRRRDAVRAEKEQKRKDKLLAQTGDTE